MNQIIAIVTTPSISCFVSFLFVCFVFERLVIIVFFSVEVMNSVLLLMNVEKHSKEVVRRCKFFFPSTGETQIYRPQPKLMAATQIFFPSTGETEIYRPQPKLMVATQKVRSKPRTARQTKLYRSKPSLNYISKNCTSGTHFPMINPIINLYRLIKPQ